LKNAFLFLLQKRITELYTPGPYDPRWRYSFAVDVAYHKDDAYVAGVLYDMVNEKEVERKLKCTQVTFPYVPGLLYAREAPPILELMSELKLHYDILIVNGHGRLHPRKAGLATVVGILLDAPTIGIAKRLLYGKVISKGSVNPVIADGKVEGFEVISGGKKFYASPGNRLDVDAVYEFLKARRFTFPKELDLADRESKRFKRSLTSRD
jgi:deoxyribonuclease V